MAGSQENEMAQWFKNHPEMYNKGRKNYRDMGRKEVPWATQARAMAMAGEFHLCNNPFNVFDDHVIIFILLEVVCVEYHVNSVSLDV